MNVNHADTAYRTLLETILVEGRDKGDRTGTGTRSVFGYQMRFDLQEGFPLLTTKKMWWKGIAVELMWFLQGRTDLRYLLEHRVGIWTANMRSRYEKRSGDQVSDKEFAARIMDSDEFNDQYGDCNKIYGYQWRQWGLAGAKIDQLGECVSRLRNNPDSRRHVITAWNPTDIPDMVLPPCHCLFQFYSRPMNEVELRESAAKALSGRSAGALEHLVGMSFQELSDHCEQLGAPRRFLDCQMYQRSADVFLGVPFNIASYALLVHMVAQVTEHVPGDFVHTFGDVHLYNNHFDQAQEQIEREPFPMPDVELNSVSRLDDFTYQDIKLVGYESHPAIKAKMAV